MTVPPRGGKRRGQRAPSYPRASRGRHAHVLRDEQPPRLGITSPVQCGKRAPPGDGEEERRRRGETLGDRREREEEMQEDREEEEVDREKTLRGGEETTRNAAE